jgi:hypothetical protein
MNPFYKKVKNNLRINEDRELSENRKEKYPYSILDEKI